MYESRQLIAALAGASLFLSACGQGSERQDGNSAGDGGGWSEAGTAQGSRSSGGSFAGGVGGLLTDSSGGRGGSSGGARQTGGATGAGDSDLEMNGDGGRSSTGNGGTDTDAAGAAGAGGNAGQDQIGGSSTSADDAAAGDAGVASGGVAGEGGAGEPDPVVVEQFPAGVVDMFPVPGAMGVCPDPVLYLRFDTPIRLAEGGGFVVYEDDPGGAAVATVDLAQQTVAVNVGGEDLRIPPPVFALSAEPSASVDTLVVSLIGGRFELGRTYRVLLEGNPVLTEAGQPALANDLDWRFSTRTDTGSDGPQLKMGYHNDADYCSLQGALDAASDGTEIRIEPGTYLGLARLNGKSGLTLRGQDRNTTHLVGTNNEQLNGGTRSRPLFLVQNGSELTIEGVTIRNLTPQGGSQAEALAMLDCDKCIVRDTTIESLQDTLLWQGRIYAEQCLIVGNVDYIWGSGTAYFNDCEIRTVGRAGYNLQARNASGSYGYVFVDSRLTADPGITGDILARIEVDRFPGSQVAYVDCEMGAHIAPEGWIITGGTPSSQLRFWEYRSHKPDGTLIDTSRRLGGSRQMTEAEAQTLRDPANVLGGWSP